MQMSGLHLHIETHGNDAPYHGTHLHQADTSGHDHNADIDVQILDQLSPTWAKMIPLLLICAILLIVLGWSQQLLWVRPAPIGALRRRNRWRPPLRAPPTPN